MSDLSSTFIYHLKVLGGPQDYETEYRFHPTRRWRFDLAWPNHKVAVECDGMVWQAGGGRHNTDKDREKINTASSMGWTVLRFSGKQIKSDPHSCINFLKDALLKGEKKMPQQKNTQKSLLIKMVDPKTLKFADYNPREISEHDFDHVKQSLKKYGFVEPVVVNQHKGRENIIIGGHMRVRAAIDIGIDKIPVNYENLDIKDEKELNVRLNRNHGDFDSEKMANYFDHEELLEYGFTEEELLGGDKLQLEPEETQGDDDIPESAPPITVKGDLYELGGHRLLCGDSTTIDDIEKLMDGIKADMVFTDPPYGVNYQSNMRVKSQKFEVLENDDSFISEWINHLPIINKGFIFIFTSWKVLYKWIELTKQIGDISNMIIWDKGGGGIGDLKKTFATDYEVALVWHNDNEIIGKRIGSVWDCGKDRASEYMHPTQKPVNLPETAIISVTKQGQIINDLFCGSGSTLIACEKTNRKCYGMELDEKYCDVIVKRYVDFCKKNDREYSVLRNGKICKDFE